MSGSDKRSSELTGREDVRRKQNSVVISFIVLHYTPPRSSPVHVIMKHSTNEQSNFLYPDGRQDKRDTQHYIGLASDPGLDRSKPEVNDRHERQTIRVEA